MPGGEENRHALLPTVGVRPLSLRSRLRLPVVRRAGHGPAAQSLRRVALPGHPPRPSGHQRRIAGRGVACDGRDGCRGAGGHWRRAQSARRHGADAALHCHGGPPGLSVCGTRHGAHHGDARPGCTRAARRIPGASGRACRGHWRLASRVRRGPPAGGPAPAGRPAAPRGGAPPPDRTVLRPGGVDRARRSARPGGTA